MAIVKSGPFLGFAGTVDGITYYQLPSGVTVAKRKNKKSTKPRTEGQKATQSTHGMISKFMQPFEEIAKVGYQHVSKSTGLNPHNAMVSHIWKTALDGPPDNRKVDLHKLLITQGDLPASAENSVRITAAGLSFTWSTENRLRNSHYSDQVILFAYFPTLRESEVKLGGAERRAGTDTLPLSGIEKGHPAEIFISFIANDHSSLSNSIYLGQLIW